MNGWSFIIRGLEKSLCWPCKKLKKKKKSFGLLDCVHLLQECANHSFQADIPTKGNLEPFLSGHMNMSGNLTCFIDLMQQLPTAYSLQPQSGGYIFNIPSMFSVLWPFLWYRLPFLQHTPHTHTHTPNIIVEALGYFQLVRKKPCKARVGSLASVNK